MTYPLFSNYKIWLKSRLVESESIAARTLLLLRKEGFVILGSSACSPRRRPFDEVFESARSRCRKGVVSQIVMDAGKLSGTVETVRFHSVMVQRRVKAGDRTWPGGSFQWGLKRNLESGQRVPLGQILFYLLLPR